MACTASIPNGAITLELPGNPDTGLVGYREEVLHPALPFPKVATGTLTLVGNGRLIRHQLTPEVEIVEIGEDVLFVRKGQDGEPNMLPIPEKMQSLFGFLRKVASGADRNITLPADPAREADPDGWRMLFGSYSDETSIWLIGCAAHLRGFLVRTGDGIERRTMFVQPSGRTE